MRGEGFWLQGLRSGGWGFGDCVVGFRVWSLRFRGWGLAAGGGNLGVRFQGLGPRV